MGRSARPKAENMSTDDQAFGQPCISIATDKQYDQFVLFGDSITQQSGCQDRGFAFAPALQDGMRTTSLSYPCSSMPGPPMILFFCKLVERFPVASHKLMVATSVQHISANWTSSIEGLGRQSISPNRLTSRLIVSPVDTRLGMPSKFSLASCRIHLKPLCD